MADRWNGSKWGAMAVPNPGSSSFSLLASVNCMSASLCIAVGGHDTSTHGYTLAERWNGRSWSIQRTPTPTGLITAPLEHVSCPATNACVAVGVGQISSGLISTLAERWNGSAWALQSTPNPTGSKSSTLTADSCVSTAVCEAVGYWLPTTTTQHTLAERYS
jgi:hypothetical protein